MSPYDTESTIDLPLSPDLAVISASLLSDLGYLGYLGYLIPSLFGETLILEDRSLTKVQDSSVVKNPHCPVTAPHMNHSKRQAFSSLLFSMSHFVRHLQLCIVYRFEPHDIAVLLFFDSQFLLKTSSRIDLPDQKL